MKENYQKQLLTKLHVLDLFNNCCARCHGTPVVVHEIIPKSKKPKDWWISENRIPLCASCHQWAHSKGYKYSQEELQRLRDAKNSAT